MKKYRIIEKGPNDFIVQQKGWFLWRDWGYYEYDTVFFTEHFYSAQDAKNAIKEVLCALLCQNISIIRK